MSDAATERFHANVKAISDSIDQRDRSISYLSDALRRIERESMIEGANQGDPNADSIERSQALDALAEIRGIARNAVAQVSA